jgi:hypothetical protein
VRWITERRNSTEDFQKVRPIEAHTRDDTFDVGASSNPTKFSKLLKIIEQCIQKTYKDPEDMVKTIQQMKRVILNYPEKPKKTDAACCNANRDPDPDMIEMAVFAWQCSK